jgi:Glycosyl hydrolases family 16
MRFATPIKTVFVKQLAILMSSFLLSLGAQATQSWTDYFNNMNNWSNIDNVRWPGNLATMKSANAWTGRVSATDANNILRLRLVQTKDANGNLVVTGAQIKTKNYFYYGDYEVRMRPAGGHPGMDTGFFLYSHSSNENTPDNGSDYWHEIDFEFLSYNTGKIHTNIYNQKASDSGSSGVANNDRDFAWAGGYNNYKIKWRKQGDLSKGEAPAFTWQVNGRNFRTWNANAFGGSMRAHLNIWAPDPRSWNVGNIDGAGTQYSTVDWFSVNEL